jgi:hypothetical protein
MRITGCHLIKQRLVIGLTAIKLVQSIYHPNKICALFAGGKHHKPGTKAGVVNICANNPATSFHIISLET